MRIALFANDPFGSYVLDTIQADPAELVCIVGNTTSTHGRLRRKLRRIRQRPGRLLNICRSQFSPTPTPPHTASRSPANGLPRLRESATRLGIPFFEDWRLADPAFADTLRAFDLDLIVVATFCVILRPRILELPKRGCINFHMALLPKYRGPTPEVCCLLDGATESGVTAHYIDAGIDTGAIIAQTRVEVAATDGFADLQHKLYPAGRELLADVLARFAAGEESAEPQDESRASTGRLPASFQRIDPLHTSGRQIHDILRACLGTCLAPYLVDPNGQYSYLLEASWSATKPAQGEAVLPCRDGFLVVHRSWRPR